VFSGDTPEGCRDACVGHEILLSLASAWPLRVQRAHLPPKLLARAKGGSGARAAANLDPVRCLHFRQRVPIPSRKREKIRGFHDAILSHLSPGRSST
jgi:hypothetical protein